MKCRKESMIMGIVLPQLSDMAACELSEISPTPQKSRCGKCGMRRAPGVLFGVFGVCLGPKLELFMRRD